MKLYKREEYQENKPKIVLEVVSGNDLEKANSSSDRYYIVNQM